MPTDMTGNGTAPSGLGFGLARDMDRLEKSQRASQSNETSHMSDGLFSHGHGRPERGRRDRLRTPDRVLRVTVEKEKRWPHAT